MTKKEVDFETWFDLIQMNLADRGIQFNDVESVRVDYDAGRDLHDVEDEIALEYEV